MCLVFRVSCLVFVYDIFGFIFGCSITKHQTPNTKHSRKKIDFLTFYETFNIDFF